MKEKMRARRTAGKGCCIVIVAFVSLIIFGRQARRQAEKEGGRRRRKAGRPTGRMEHHCCYAGFHFSLYTGRLECHTQEGAIECHLKARGGFALCVFACMCVCVYACVCVWWWVREAC